MALLGQKQAFEGESAMTRSKSLIEVAAGHLISAIQKEWNEELGTEQAAKSESVMYLAHDLLNACKRNDLGKLLGSKSIEEFLGQNWVQVHPYVQPAIAALQDAREFPLA